MHTDPFQKHFRQLHRRYLSRKKGSPASRHRPQIHYFIHDCLLSPGVPLHTALLSGRTDRSSAQGTAPLRPAAEQAVRLFFLSVRLCQKVYFLAKERLLFHMRERQASVHRHLLRPQHHPAYAAGSADPPRLPPEDVWDPAEWLVQVPPDHRYPVVFVRPFFSPVSGIHLFCFLYVFWCISGGIIPGTSSLPWQFPLCILPFR